MILSIIKNLFGGTGEKSVPLQELEDEELMARYAEGDSKAFEVIFERHKGPVFHFILRSVRRDEVAEELLQEVFLRVIRQSQNYKPTAKFTTWLYTIARNICIDRSRRQKHRRELSLDVSIGQGEEDGATWLDRVVDETGTSQAADVDRSAFRARLEEALEALPEEQREVFVMREFSGLKFREIAEVLDCPVPTIKSRMRYALEGLRQHLADFEDASFDRTEREDMERAK